MNLNDDPQLFYPNNKFPTNQPTMNNEGDTMINLYNLASAPSFPDPPSYAETIGITQSSVSHEECQRREQDLINERDELRKSNGRQFSYGVLYTISMVVLLFAAYYIFRYRFNLYH